MPYNMHKQVSNVRRKAHVCAGHENYSKSKQCFGRWSIVGAACDGDITGVGGTNVAITYNDFPNNINIYAISDLC